MTSMRVDRLAVGLSLSIIQLKSYEEVLLALL